MLKIIFYIGFILSFFDSFVLYIVPNTNASIQCAFFIWLSVIVVCLINNHKRFFNFYRRIFKLSLIKVLMCTFLYVFLLSLVHIMLGHYIAVYRVYLFKFYKFLIACPLLYLYPVLALYLKISLKKIIRIYLLITYIALFIGIIQYISNALNLTFVNFVIDILTNARAGSYDLNEFNNSKRIFSIFAEPSVIGYFAFINMPLIYHFSVEKYKIFENIYLNKLIKMTFLPVTVLVVILSFSPIGIIFCFFSLWTLLIYKIRKKIAKFFPFLIIIFLVLSFICYHNLENNVDSDSVVIQRINKTIISISDLSTLVVVEQSFASRLISTQILINVIARNPVFGIGFLNTDCYVDTIFDELPIKYYTLEILKNHMKFANATPINESIFFTTFAETGCIGISLFIYFNILNIILLYRVSKNLFGIEKIFATSLAQCIISILIYSIYTSTLRSVHIWLIYGCSLLCIAKYKYNIATQKKLSRYEEKNIKCKEIKKD